MVGLAVNVLKVFNPTIYRVFATVFVIGGRARNITMYYRSHFPFLFLAYTKSSFRTILYQTRYYATLPWPQYSELAHIRFEMFGFDNLNNDR